MKNEKSCGFILIREHQALLLKHRSGNHWDFCKGHMEKKETELETALREVKEELGGMVEPLGGFREVIAYSPKPGVDKIVVFFLGRYHGTVEPQALEILETQWVNFDEVYEKLTYEENKRLWLKALKHIEKYHL